MSAAQTGPGTRRLPPLADGSGNAAASMPASATPLAPQGGSGVTLPAETVITAVRTASCTSGSASGRGCLSMTDCPLRNPGDPLGERGDGAVLLEG